MSILKYFLLGFGAHLAAGRRVRDLQHAVDHRRPAHAGVRDAADARRLAQAGHALGRRRGLRHRPAGLGDRAARRDRAREGPGRAVRRAWASSCRTRRRSSRRARSSLSIVVGTRRSRWWRASCPPSGRPACRRSRRSARAPRCRPRASPRTRSRPASSSRRRSLAAVLAGLFAGGLSALGAGALLGGGVLGAVRSAWRCWRRASSTPLARFVGWPGAPAGHRRRAGRRQRRPQPGAHRVDRRRADDRAHARDARGGRSASSLGAQTQVRDQGGGPRGLRHRRQGQMPFRAAEGDAAGAHRGRQERLARPLRHGARRRQGAHRSRASTRPRSRTSTRSGGPRAPSSRSASSGPTARS